MASQIKNVLLHLTDEEHRRLKKMKDSLKLSWEKFVLYLSQDEKSNDPTNLNNTKEIKQTK